MPKEDRKVYFSAIDCFGKRIRTSKEYWQNIVRIKHPIIRGKEVEVRKTLSKPDFVKVSKLDDKVFLYYKKANRHSICVVTRHEDGSGFIITAYLARSIAQGETVWEK